MLISKETDYAIRLLRGLRDGKLHKIADLCTEQMVSRQFAYQIVRKLQAAGIIRCVRGRYGGCILKADLSKVSIYDIMKITDNKCILSGCLAPGETCDWNKAHGSLCQVHGKLLLVQNDLIRQLQALTL